MEDNLFVNGIQTLFVVNGSEPQFFLIEDDTNFLKQGRQIHILTR